jgi:biopolymer transport protein ExbD
LVLGYLATLADPHRAIDVHLPVAPEDATSYTTSCGSEVVLRVYADGQFDVNRHVVPRDVLEQRLREVYEHRRCSAIYILAAPEVKYGTVTDFVDTAKGAGIRHIVMVIAQGGDYFSAEVPR